MGAPLNQPFPSRQLLPLNILDGNNDPCPQPLGYDGPLYGYGGTRFPNRSERAPVEPRWDRHSMGKYWEESARLRMSMFPMAGHTRCSSPTNFQSSSCWPWEGALFPWAEEGVKCWDVSPPRGPERCREEDWFRKVALPASPLPVHS